MPREEFHDRPYDDGTLTKLRIFQLYIQEWLPVFLARDQPYFKDLHIFDFFCGPGTDSNDVPGSPLRILTALRDYQKHGLAGWGKVNKFVHFFDLDPGKVERLAEIIALRELEVAGVQLDIRPEEFGAALQNAKPILDDRDAAKLLLIDQFGVDAVSDDVFRALISTPRTDFLFFLSTSTLHRFRDHPAIKQKIPHPEDSYHVHRAAFDYYKSLVPAQAQIFLGQFSIRKRSNIYGIVFGSQHPLGIHKFLQVAWRTDEIAGEANFDVDRENIGRGELLLDLDALKPKKIQGFEESLAGSLYSRALQNEADIIRFCIEFGMTGQHAAPVLARVKKEGFLACNFRVPDVGRYRNPRPIQYT